MPITVDTCCGFVTDMKSAVTMIILMAIVTNPLVSWILVRHTYAIRASCLINLDKSAPDVLGLSLTNFLSFGFGGAAGYGPSCLNPPEEDNATAAEGNKTEEDTMVKLAKSFGWFMLVADIIFLFCSIYFFAMVFQGSDRTAAGIFAWAALVSVFLGFVYGMIYVHVCIKIGHAFPLFEFTFALMDLLIWVYFIIVVLSYRVTDAS